MAVEIERNPCGSTYRTFNRKFGRLHLRAAIDTLSVTSMDLTTHKHTVFNFNVNWRRK